jgi:hypothetical protein
MLHPLTPISLPGHHLQSPYHVLLRSCKVHPDCAAISTWFGLAVAEGGGEKDDGEDLEPDGLVGGSAGTTKSSSAESIHHQQGQSTVGCSTPVQPRTASIRARPTSSRITAAELEELFQRQQGSSNGNLVMTVITEWLIQNSGTEANIATL